MKSLLLSVVLFSFALASPLAISETRVVINTSVGEITLALDESKAPETVANFLSYVDEGYYSDLIFHRVIPGFMIQGGGMDEAMQPKQTRPAINNEANNGLKNLRGSIAMARTRDPDSATAQFFINLVDNSFLNYSVANPGYAVFGRVVEGMEIVDSIGQVETGSSGFFKDVPKQPIFIKEMIRVED